MTSPTKHQDSSTSPVFMSGAPEDADFAHRLAGDLSEAGVAVWLSRALDLNGSGVSTTFEKLDEASALVLVLSSASAQSDDVHEELRRFLGAPIVPVLLEEVNWGLLWWASAELPIDFRGDQYAAAFQSLLAALAKARRPPMRGSTGHPEESTRARARRASGSHDGLTTPSPLQTDAQITPSPSGARSFDVFISYKSEDLEHAQRVAAFLRAANLHVFFSRDSLGQLGSDEYQQQIDLAVESARHMIVVASSGAHARARWVDHEWRLFLGEKLAGRKSGNLMCVLAEGMRIEDLPISLRNREVVRLVPEDLERLLQYMTSDTASFDGTTSRTPGSDPAPRGAIGVAPSPAQDASLVRVSDFLVSKREFLKEVTWLAASTHAAELSLARSEPWRLPSIDELRLIRKAGAFPSEVCYWSSKEAPGDEAFYVHFDDGHVGHGPKDFSRGLCAVFVAGGR